MQLWTICGSEAWVCGREDCRARQLRHAVIAGKGKAQTALYVPLPKQAYLAELAERVRRVCFGGAAGGSKSHSARWLLHEHALKVPGFHGLLLRRTYPELDNTHLERVGPEAAAVGAQYLKSERKVRYANGSVVEFGHCEDDGAVARYLSTEYDGIVFDELVTFTEHQFLMISSRCGRTRRGFVVGGTNPGGPGAAWVRARFIDHSTDRQAFPDYRPGDYAYLPATLDDNPYIDAAYEENLNDLPEELRRAYRFGDWDIFPGQYFSEWRRTRHVGVVNVGAGVQWVRAVDWGYVKPGVCLWIACLPDGRAYVAEEYVFRTTIAQEVAREIRKRSEGRKVRYTVGDTQMWTPDAQTGETIAETFARNGVSMMQADKERVNGWQRMRHWLRDAPDGKPWLMVSPDCPYTIRTIPALVQDTHRPEDVDSDGEDHAADSLRYFCMSRPSPTRIVVPRKPVDPLSTSHIWADLLRPSRKVLGSENVRTA